jgi:hypothetical protein
MDPFSALGPMAHSADLCLMFSAMMFRTRDPLSAVVRNVARRDVFARPRQPTSAPRVAATTDFGFAPTERVIAGTFRDKLKYLDHAFAGIDEAHPDAAAPTGRSRPSAR